jgi:hypothetical protein
LTKYHLNFVLTAMPIFPAAHPHQVMGAPVWTGHRLIYPVSCTNATQYDDFSSMTMFLDKSQLALILCRVRSGAGYRGHRGSK